MWRRQQSGAILYQPRNTKDFRQSPGAGWEAWHEAWHSLAKSRKEPTLPTPCLQTSGLQRIHFRRSQLASLWSFVMAAHANKYRNCTILFMIACFEMVRTGKGVWINVNSSWSGHWLLWRTVPCPPATTFCWGCQWREPLRSPLKNVMTLGDEFTAGQEGSGSWGSLIQSGWGGEGRSQLWRGWGWEMGKSKLLNWTVA